jgi:hypothetical protein
MPICSGGYGVGLVEAQLAARLSRGFRLVRRLGKAGECTVYLAEQIGAGNRPAALKVRNRDFVNNLEP